MYLETTEQLSKVTEWKRVCDFGDGGVIYSYGNYRKLALAGQVDLFYQITPESPQPPPKDKNLEVVPLGEPKIGLI